MAVKSRKRTKTEQTKVEPKVTLTSEDVRYINHLVALEIARAQPIFLPPPVVHGTEEVFGYRKTARFGSAISILTAPFRFVGRAVNRVVLTAANVVRGVISATQRVEIGQTSLSVSDNFYMALTLLSVGWGGIEILSINYRPVIGFECHHADDRSYWITCWLLGKAFQFHSGTRSDGSDGVFDDES